MYSYNMEDGIRATEIVLGDPPNRGVSPRAPEEREAKGKPLFDQIINYQTGDVQYIPVKDE